MSELSALAISRATSELKARHRAEYYRLIDEQRAELGLAPVRPPITRYWVIGKSARQAQGYIKRELRRGPGARQRSAEAVVVRDYLTFNHGRVWTDDDELVFLEGWRERTDLVRITKHLERLTGSTIDVLLHRFGVTK